MTYPVQNIARRTSLLRVDLIERQLEGDTTVRPDSVLRGTEDGDGGGEGDGGGGPALLHSQGSRPSLHQQPGKLRLAPSLLSAGSHNVVFSLGLALDLKHRALSWTKSVSAVHLPSVPSSSGPQSESPPLGL